MNSLLAVYRFELKRILTPGRAFWWFVVAAFPVAITLLMTTYLRLPEGVSQQEIDTLFTIALYFLAPSVACMLGVLLTAAPTVATELEQHSWIYLATRPNGLFHLIMGKYLVAVTWASSATALGVLVSVPLSRIEAKAEVLLAMIALCILSAFAYGALYMMIGTLFHARAMVFCVAYTAGIELFLGMFPAVINRLTIQFRLRSLLFHWTTQSKEFMESGVLEYVASDESVLLQLTWLAAFTAIFICMSLVSVQVREFTTAAESEL